MKKDCLNDFFEEQIDFIKSEKQEEDSNLNEAKILFKERNPESIERASKLMLKFTFAIQNTDDLKKFTKGTNVILESLDNKRYDGVLTTLSDEQVGFSCADPYVDESITASVSDEYFDVSAIGSDITYQRMSEAVERIRRQMESNNASSLTQMIFTQAFEQATSSKGNEIVFENQNLNSLQKQCVTESLESDQIYCIHGPPGTGKTTVLLEVVQQLMRMNKRVLFVAPSNVATDNLLLKLPKDTKHIIRLGRLARIDPKNHHYHLDVKVGQIIDKPSKKLTSRLNGLSVSRVSNTTTDHMRMEALKTEYMQNALLFASTLTNIDFAYFFGLKKSSSDEYPFDVIIMDECSQALISAGMIPLELAEKMIIAGDHRQLQPTVLSNKYKGKESSLSFMEFLTKLIPDTMMKMLLEQYRMNLEIMAWPSSQFYDNKLIANVSCRNGSVNDLIQSKKVQPKIFLIDCSNGTKNEVKKRSSSSFANNFEASVIMVHIKTLIDLKVDPSQISIVTPCTNQVSLIKQKLAAMDGLSNQIEVNSADGFQGRENQIIIISLVRSNSKKQIGFMNDLKRLNVAITRAKRQLVVAADLKTFSKEPVISDFLDYCARTGEKRSGNDYITDYKNLEKRYPKLKTAGSKLVNYNQGSSFNLSSEGLGLADKLDFYSLWSF